MAVEHTTNRRPAFEGSSNSHRRPRTAAASLIGQPAVWAHAAFLRPFHLRTPFPPSSGRAALLEKEVAEDLPAANDDLSHPLLQSLCHRHGFASYRIPAAARIARSCDPAPLPLGARKCAFCRWSHRVPAVSARPRQGARVLDRACVIFRVSDGLREGERGARQNMKRRVRNQEPAPGAPYLPPNMDVIFTPPTRAHPRG